MLFKMKNSIKKYAHLSYLYFPGHQNGHFDGCVLPDNTEHLWSDPFYTSVMDSGCGRNSTSIFNCFYLLLLCKYLI